MGGVESALQASNMSSGEHVCVIGREKDNDALKPPHGTWHVMDERHLAAVWQYGTHGDHVLHIGSDTCGGVCRTHGVAWTRW